jgi:hypothetical protein
MTSDQTCRGPGGHTSSVPQAIHSQDMTSGAFVGGPDGKAISANNANGSYWPVWTKKGVSAGTIT